MLDPIKSFAKLDGLVKEREISFYRLGKETGIPTSFFSEWKRGKMMPKADKLIILSDYFSVPRNYLEVLKEERCTASNT